MKSKDRLSAAVHALLRLAELRDSITAEELASSLEVNPVVLRQTLVGLFDSGIVRTERGNNAWTLGREPVSISLRDVYVALGEPSLFVLRNRSEMSECLVEKSVDDVLASAFADAQAMLVERLGSLSLASLAADTHP